MKALQVFNRTTVIIGMGIALMPAIAGIASAQVESCLSRRGPRQANQLTENCQNVEAASPSKTLEKKRQFPELTLKGPNAAPHIGSDPLSSKNQIGGGQLETEYKGFPNIILRGPKRAGHL